MSASFPEKSPAELRHLEKAFYHHFADYIVETIKLAHISMDELQRRAKLNNPELIDKLMAEGHTCIILLMGHYGNWEWFCSSSTFFEDARVYDVYRPLTNPAADRIFIKLRSIFGSIGIKKNDTIPRHHPPQANRHPIGGYFPGRSNPQQGQPALLDQLPESGISYPDRSERIARKLNLPVVFIDTKKVSRGFYTVDNATDHRHPQIHTRVLDHRTICPPHGTKHPPKPSLLAVDTQAVETQAGNIRPHIIMNPPTHHIPLPAVSIVILNWNGRALMEEFLPSVLRYSPASTAEIVVADNGSTDDSVAMLQQRFPTVRLIRLDQNYGFAEGYNQALKEITTEYTVLLNSVCRSNRRLARCSPGRPEQRPNHRLRSTQDTGTTR